LSTSIFNLTCDKFQIFVAECRRQNKFTEFFNSQANNKITICHKMQKIKCQLYFGRFYFFQAITGLTYKELGKCFLPAKFCDKIWNLLHIKLK
jgi:hypothetical protein